MAPAKKSGTAKTALEMGAAALAVAAAAGATYYFYGDQQAKKHRQAAAKWAKGLKADVLTEAKKLKQVDRAAMTAIVNKAAQAYRGARNLDANDLKAAAAELKKNWRKIEAEIRGVTGAKKAPAAPKKTAPKKAAPKKAAKKSA